MVGWKWCFIIVSACICFTACGFDQLLSRFFAISEKGRNFLLWSLESPDTLSPRPTSHIFRQNYFFSQLRYNLHTVNFTPFSIRFCKLHIPHSKHRTVPSPQKIPAHPFVVNPSPLPSAPGNPPVFCPCSFTFSRMSGKWNQTAGSF